MAGSVASYEELAREADLMQFGFLDGIEWQYREAAVHAYDHMRATGATETRVPFRQHRGYVEVLLRLPSNAMDHRKVALLLLEQQMRVQLGTGWLS